MAPPRASSIARPGAVVARPATPSPGGRARRRGGSPGVAVVAGADRHPRRSPALLHPVARHVAPRSTATGPTPVVTVWAAGRTARSPTAVWRGCPHLITGVIRMLALKKWKPACRKSKSSSFPVRLTTWPATASLQC